MPRSAKDMKGSGGGRNYELSPVLDEDIYPARLVQYIELGTQKNRPFNGKPKKDSFHIWLTYEMGDVFMLDEDGNELEDKPRWISEEMSLFSSDQENAKSTKRKAALDPTDEVDDLWECLGFPCQVDLVHRENKNDPDHPYENISAIAKAGKRVQVPELVNDTVLFEIDNPDWDVWHTLPNFLQEKILKSRDWVHGEPPANPNAEQDDGDGGYDEEEEEAPKRPARKKAAKKRPARKKAAPPPVEEEDDDWEDDIPF